MCPRLSDSSGVNRDSRILPAIRTCLCWIVLATQAAAQAPGPRPAPGGDAPVRLAADIWPPFTGSADDGDEGYMVEIARLAFNRAGLDVVYHNVSWERALQGTTAGHFDGAVGASAADGAGLILPAQELAVNRLAFLVRKGDPWRFHGVSSLASVRLGVIQGYDYRDWLGAWIARHRQDPSRVQELAGAEALSDNLRKLLAGRVDVVVDSETALRHAARKLHSLDRVEVAGVDDEAALCTIGFTPVGERGRRLARIFDREVARLRADGSLDSLLSRHGLKDWRARSGTRRP